MNPRAAALVLAVAATALPAYAEDPQPGFSTQLSGGVVATSDVRVPGYSSVAVCFFAGVLLPNNTLDIGYGGFAAAIAVTAPPRVPQQTIYECRLTNDRGNVANFIWTNGGSATAHSGLATGWPWSPITVCTRARAFYGPQDALDIDTGYECARDLVGS